MAAIIEFLETRRLLSAITVDIAGDTPQPDHITLREAVAQANLDGTGDTITFASNLSGSTITLTQGELLLTGSMTINGLGSSKLTIDGNTASRIFDISDGSSVTTQNVTITNLSLQHGVGTGAYATTKGGAIYSEENLTLTSDILSGNSAIEGGALYCKSGVLTSTNDTFSGNIATTSVGLATGGAILNYGTIVSTNDTFTENTSDSQGQDSEAAAIFNAGTLTVTNDTISNNTAVYGEAGGIFNIATLISTNTTYSGNTAHYCGAILNYNIMNSTNDTFTGNVATQEQGGIGSNGSLILTNDTITNNTSSNGAGGGIYINFGTLDATNTIIIGNKQISGGDVNGTFTANSRNNLTSLPIGKTLSDVLQTDAGGAPILANHGGPTQTIALANATGNPALGIGGTLATVTASGDGNTTLTVDSTTFLAAGDQLRIGSEIVTVTAVSTATTLKVLRGQVETSQTNLNGLAIVLAFDQRGRARNPQADLGAFETQIPTVTNVTDSSGDYTGNAFAVTDTTVTGVGTQVIAMFGATSLSYTYYAGTLSAADLAGVNPLRGAPIDVGNYTVVATFTSNVTGYRSATSRPVHFSITAATASITITPYSVLYDGNAHTATGVATGARNESLAANLTFTNTTHTTVGVYAGDTWSFHDPNGNYQDASGTISDSIGKAMASITITPYNVTYDGASHTATGTANGAKNESLTAGLTLIGTTHSNAGTYVNEAWTFQDTSGNYQDASGTFSDIIAQASATITITPYSVTYDGKTYTATGKATGLNNQSLAGDLTLTGTTHTNAGAYVSDAWSFHDASGNYKDVNGTVSDNIAQVVASITITPYSVIYDGNAHTATGVATGAKNESLAAGLTLSGTLHTNAGTYLTDSWSFHDANGNYKDASGTVGDAIGKATASITITPYSVIYDGNAHNATGKATGVKNESLVAGLTLTGTKHTNAGAYVSDTWSFHDPNGNYKDASGTVRDIIGKATASIAVTPYSVTYDGNTHTATGVATGAKNESLAAGLTLTGTTHTNVGAYTNDAWSFHDPNGNYQDASGTVRDIIGKATALITITPYSVTYDGNAHAATGTATGARNESLAAGLTLTGTKHTNAGTYLTDSWSFHDASGNYKDASGTVGNTIGKATASITITPYSVTYDGNAHTATGVATGAKNESLAAGLTLSGTLHTNAGTYLTDSWSFHDANGNYKDASGTGSDAIGKATASITITPYSVIYDGNAHTATGKATGAKNESLVAGLTLSGTSHTNAGTYLTDSWSFHDANGNYKDASGTVSDNIAQVVASITITPYSVIYDGNVHTATGKATGAKNESLAAGLTLSGTSHTNAGTYVTDSWSFHDANGNYKDASGTVGDAIGKATASITITPYSVIYDGNAHNATGKATGVKNESLVAGLTLTGTKHTNAGAYVSDTWSFHDPNGNYKDASGTVRDIIGKATASIAVTPYSVTYDGNTHTATGVATGAKNESLAAGLTLTGTSHTNAGTYVTDSWSFHDPNGNYKDASGTGSDAIGKATASITITPYSVIYDGNAHTATGKATGAKNESLVAGLTLSGTLHTNAGAYVSDTWSFHDAGGNYKDANGTVIDSIAQAAASITITPYSVTYDGNSRKATGSPLQNASRMHD